VIPRAFIDAWRSHAPWRSDAQVEQDLVICRVVAEIFRHPVLSQRLLFRGGTALHKLCFGPPRRYSEDVDLVQCEAGSIGPIFDGLREALDPLLGKPRRKQGPGVVTLTYRMDSEIPPIMPLKLKVEINTREHFTVLGVQRKRFAVDSPWFHGSCEVATFCLEELLGTKLRALYQRRKGRDLFDLWLGLTEGRADPQRIVECFNQYMAHAGHAVTRGEFELNLAAKRGHPGFAADLHGLLPVGLGYELDAGFAIVTRELLARL